jgi:RNA polymerase sigma-70 factor, ECF subfamily
MSGKYTDKILLYKIQQQQDPEKYGQLYDKYVKQIYRFVYFKVSSHEEAEDITSEVFLKAWNFLQTKKEVRSFSGLLYRISRNCVIDLYRRRSTRTEALDESSADELFEKIHDDGSWIAQLDSRVEAERAVQSLKKLKQEYQEVITLRYVDELEIDEIAEIMDKGPVAVRVTLHRALKKLKFLLEVK